MANIPLAGQTDVLAQAASRFGTDFENRLAKAKAAGIDVSKIDPTVGFLLASVDPDKQFEMTRRFLDDQEQRQMRQAEKAQQLGKESLSETTKYKMLFDLPRQLTAAYTIPAAIEAQGAANIANIMTNAGAYIPNLVGFQRGSYAYTPVNYFS